MKQSQETEGDFFIDKNYNHVYYYTPLEVSDENQYCS
jgi:hypothetical protein